MNTKMLTEMRRKVRNVEDIKRYMKIPHYTSQIKDYEINGHWGTKKEAIADCLAFFKEHPYSRYSCTVTYWDGKETEILGSCSTMSVEGKKIVVFFDYKNNNTYEVRSNGSLGKRIVYVNGRRYRM